MGVAFFFEENLRDEHYDLQRQACFSVDLIIYNTKLITNTQVFTSPTERDLVSLVSYYTPVNTFSVPSILHVWLHACGDLDVSNGHIWFLSFLALLTNALECCLITSCTPFK